MMRPVTRAFSANDREKNDRTNEAYNSSAAGDEVAIRLGVFERVVTEIARGTSA